MNKVSSKQQLKVKQKAQINEKLTKDKLKKKKNSFKTIENRSLYYDGAVIPSERRYREDYIVN